MVRNRHNRPLAHMAIRMNASLKIVLLCLLPFSAMAQGRMMDNIVWYGMGQSSQQQSQSGGTASPSKQGCERSSPGNRCECYGYSTKSWQYEKYDLTAGEPKHEELHVCFYKDPITAWWRDLWRQR